MRSELKDLIIMSLLQYMGINIFPTEGKHSRIQKVLSEMVQLGQLFFFLWSSLVDKKRGDPNIIKSGPSSARHRFAGRLMMTNIKCWHASFVIFTGIWTSIAKKPYSFLIFQEGRGSFPPPPHLWIRTWKD